MKDEKILRVTKLPTKKPFNQYLSEPWKEGEIVKVCPLEEQVSACGTKVTTFRKQYVKVLRKDKAGDWSLIYTAPWEYFEPIKKGKKQ